MQFNELKIQNTSNITYDEDCCINHLYLYCQDAWQGLHGYLSIVVCVLGVFFNLLNILVLGHREMRANPINLILFSIAVADILLMLEYIPFTVHMYILDQHTRTREEKVGIS